jgi:hypothetical protein
MLDDLIDGVAREMTASHPSVGFTRRVIARVAELESEGHSRRRWQSVWLLGPAAVLIVALAVLVFHDRLGWQPSVRPGSNPTSRTVPAQKMVAEALRPLAEATDTTPRAQARPRAAGAHPGSTAPTVVATLDPDLAPLVTPPLAVEALGVAPLAQAVPIEVDALSIGRIDIAAMP